MKQITIKKTERYGDLFDRMLKDSYTECIAEASKLNVEKVIFNNNATIVYFNDNTKTVVKRQEGDVWSKEVGLMAAFSKKLFGNDNTFNKIVNRYCSEYYNDNEDIQYGLEKLASNLKAYEGAAKSDEAYDYSKEAYEKVCNDINQFVIVTEEDVDKYHELIEIKNAIKSHNRLFESIYMTDSYIAKRVSYFGSTIIQYYLPEYAATFIKLAKKHFDVDLTVVNIKDNKFKIILNKEGYYAKQK